MTKKHADKSKRTLQPAILIGVALVVAVILIVKARQSSTEAAVQVLPTTSTSGTAAVQVFPPTSTVAQASSTPASGAAQPGASGTALPMGLAGLSPEAQIDRLVAAKQPIFAFFHSNTCKQCVDMTAIVEQVYPDFNSRVYLVDVNVYDRDNQNLLQRANLRVIPTLIFIDRSGEAWGYTGVIPADDLREQLQTLAGEG